MAMAVAAATLAGIAAKIELRLDNLNVVKTVNEYEMLAADTREWMKVEDRDVAELFAQYPPHRKC